MDKDKRDKFVREMQKGVADFISGLKPKKYEDGWPEDRWEEEMEKHPAFMSKPVEDGQDLPPLVEAMQQLKYDPEINSPTELALAYKEDGNQNFQKKKYRWAIDSYTKGLDVKCEDKELNAVLHCNRATMHYYTGHFQKALNDATEAKNLNPAYFKAFSRGALCFFELQLYEQCILWCDKGLKLKANDATLIETKRKAQNCKEKADLLKKETYNKKSKEALELKLLNKAIKERGICFKQKGGFTAECVQPLQGTGDAKVHLTSEGVLVWPVIFLYPEYNTTDLVQAFDELTCFYDHFEVMFKEPPSWDTKGEYIPKKLQVYFSDGDAIFPVDEKQSLLSAMCNPKFQLQGGILTFIVTVKNSTFDGHYRKDKLAS